jgi:WD40 repeat protein
MTKDPNPKECPIPNAQWPTRTILRGSHSLVIGAWAFFAVGVFGIWACHGLAHAISQDTTPPANKTPDEKTIRALIAQLGDDSFDKREAADKALGALGSAALPLLRKAAADATDLEVRERAAKLVRTIGAAGPGFVLPGSSVRHLAISNDGQTLAFGCENKIVSVYDMKTIKPSAPSSPTWATSRSRSAKPPPRPSPP